MSSKFLSIVYISLIKYKVCGGTIAFNGSFYSEKTPAYLGRLRRLLKALRKDSEKPSPNVSLQSLDSLSSPTIQPLRGTTSITRSCLEGTRGMLILENSGRSSSNPMWSLSSMRVPTTQSSNVRLSHAMILVASMHSTLRTRESQMVFVEVSTYIYILIYYIHNIMMG